MGLGRWVKKRTRAVGHLAKTVAKPAVQATRYVARNPVRVLTAAAGGAVLGPVGALAGATKRGARTIIKGAKYARENPGLVATAAAGAALVATGAGTTAGVGMLVGAARQGIAQEQARAAQRQAELAAGQEAAAREAAAAAAAVAAGGSPTAAVQAGGAAGVAGLVSPAGIVGRLVAWVDRLFGGR